MWDCTHCCRPRQNNITKEQCKDCEFLRCVPCRDVPNCPPHVTSILTPKQKQHTTGVSEPKETKSVTEEKPDVSKEQSRDIIDEKGKQKLGRNRKFDRAMDKVSDILKRPKCVCDTKDLTNNDDRQQSKSQKSQVSENGARGGLHVKEPQPVEINEVASRPNVDLSLLWG